MLKCPKYGALPLLDHKDKVMSSESQPLNTYQALYQITDTDCQPFLCFSLYEDAACVLDPDKRDFQKMSLKRLAQLITRWRKLRR